MLKLQKNATEKAAKQVCNCVCTYDIHGSSISTTAQHQGFCSYRLYRVQHNNRGRISTCLVCRASGITSFSPRRPLRSFTHAYCHRVICTYICVSKYCPLFADIVSYYRSMMFKRDLPYAGPWKMFSCVEYVVMTKSFKIQIKDILFSVECLAL